MRIERIHIRNFRALKDVALDLHPRLTFLLGSNNAGKSTVLDALGAVLGYRRGVLPFTELDFRSEDAAADVRAAPPIEIDLSIAPSDGSARFTPGETNECVPQLVRNPGGDQQAERVYLRLRGWFDDDPSVRGLSASPTVRKDTWEPVGGGDLARFPFASELPHRGFGTERDLRRGLGGRWSDWGALLAVS